MSYILLIASLAAVAVAGYKVQRNYNLFFDMLDMKRILIKARNRGFRNIGNL